MLSSSAVDNSAGSFEGDICYIIYVRVYFINLTRV